jgi:sugar transferase (PEP-CTERM system associated)
MASIKIFNNHLRIPFIFLWLVESIIFMVSVYSAALVRFQQIDFSYENLSSNYDGPNIGFIVMTYTLVMMLSMTALGHYQSQQHASVNMFINTVVRSLVAMAIGSIVLIILYYFFPSIYMGRGFHAIALTISLIGIISIRAFFLQYVDQNILKRNILIIGAGLKAETLIAEKGGYQDGVSYKLIGYVPIKTEVTKVPKNKVINLSMDGIYDYAIENDIDEIILAIEDRRKYYPDEELLKCKLSGIKIVDPVCFLEREQGKVNLEMMNPSWMIFSNGFGRNPIEVISARVFDVITSLLIFIIMSPVLLISAFLISAESRFRSPIFYKQVRVGMDGEEFTLYKFRSMSINAEKDGKAVWASKNDSRITLVGKFIRKTRIDELPQIINILKGDMRLVGPRPERPEFVNDLATKIPFYKKRHTVKPGLAGWAQLKYPYGATERDAYEKLQYDLYYVKNNNVIMDFFILLQTIEIVLMGKGAR